MKRSTDRILTTHVGSLARPHELLDTLKERENGRPYDAELLDRQITEAVADRVRLQVESGIDIVTDGEMSKVSFLGYVKDRLGGFEPDMGDTRMAPSWQKEVDDFPEYYAEYFKKYSSTVTPLRRIICKGPITYVGHDLVQTDIANLKAAVEPYDVADVFMPSTGPSGFGQQRVLPLARGVPRRRRRGDARGVPGDRRRRVRPAGRRPVPHRHAQRSVDGRGRAGEGGVDARRGAQSRPARHPHRADPPPHLLWPQPRTADERHPADQGRAVHARHRRRGATASRWPTRATTTSGGSGRTSTCPRAAS